MRIKKILSVNCRVDTYAAVKMLLPLLVMGAVLFNNGACKTSPQNWPREAFSPEAWKASAKEKRYVFYHDLAKSKKLDGLLRKDVLSLLGQPDFVSPGDKYITYILKYAEKGEHSFSAIYILEVDFNAQGAVSRYFIRAD
jgi:hypothetical protein